MKSTHAHFNISAREIGAKLKLHGSACPPFWILMVEWFWWRHRFQIASFSPSTLENSVSKNHRFEIAPLWRAFSNGSVFGDRFRRCSVDDSRIQSKTAPFSFENGLVWTELKGNVTDTYRWLFSFRTLWLFCGYWDGIVRNLLCFFCRQLTEFVFFNPIFCRQNLASHKKFCAKSHLSH